MKRSARIAISAGVVATTLFGMAGAFEVGGRLGYTFGSATSSSWEAVSHGIDSYRVLTQLSEDAPAELRRDLERQIDYALINWLSLVDREPHRFNLYPLPLDPCGKMPELAAHRSANPSPADDSYRIKLIDEAVRRLSSAEVSNRVPSRCGEPSAV